MGDVRKFQSRFNRTEMARMFAMDMRTVSKRLEDGAVAPVAQDANGHDLYELTTAAPALLGSGSGGPTANPRDLPPLERRAFYQSENERLKVEVATGALVPAPEVEADYAAFVKLVAQFFDTLPDVLERDCGLTGEQVERVQEACDRVRQQMFEKVLEDDVRQSA